jgi:hypothetical protein
VPRAVGFAIPNRAQASERLPPAGVRVLKVTDRRTVRLEEEILVIELASVPKLLAQRELTLQHGQCAWTQHDASILTRLSGILVVAGDVNNGQKHSDGKRAAGPRDDLGLRSKGQIDFYDDPELIGPAAAAIAKFFRASLQKL